MTMASWRRRFRAFAPIWALLQLALPMVILFADAVDARANSGQSAAHVEASTSENCRPAHTDECALCRFLSNSSAPIAHGDASALVDSDRSGFVAHQRVECGAAVGRLPESRAPPIV